MTPRQYLLQIKRRLQEGHPQWRMGASVLGAFGYTRRRQTVLDEINEVLKTIGLEAHPPVDENMPLDVPRIRFSLIGSPNVPAGAELDSLPDEAAVAEADALVSPEVKEIRVHELAVNGRPVAQVKLDDPIEKALTIMVMKNYSQLAVMESSRSIQGTVSYKSIATAYLHGNPIKVRDCLDKETPRVQESTEVLAVIRHFEKHDAVLAIASDRTLNGIITAYDVAEEFKELVDPFKRISEIETRIRRLVHARIPHDELLDILRTDNKGKTEADPDKMTLGDLGVILERPEIWNRIGIRFDSPTFIDGLNQARELRNQLMHFRDPLKQEQADLLRRCCILLRQVPSASSS